MKYKFFLVSLLILSSTGLGIAQTKLASLFTDHMVMQRNSEVKIWGLDKPNTVIKVSTNWNVNSTTTTNKDGKWETTISTKEAGGPYTVTVSGTETKVIKDVLIGEVWVCSGQSNMEMPLTGFSGQPVYDSNDIIANSQNSQLRLFKVKKDKSANPESFFEGSWEPSSPQSVAEFSAVGYMYGAILQKKLNIPVGIINSSVGGTRVEAWTKNEVLKEQGFDFVKESKRKVLDKNSASALYNAMIHPLIPYTIKGVIWYQGESNRGNASNYTSSFSAMIKSWRNDWKLGDFPFYFVQIAPFKYDPEVNAAYLREAQLETSLNVVNTGMVVTMDIGDENCIHPPQKSEVAKRLSYWALAKTYGFDGFDYASPIFKSMKVDANKVQLNFDHAKKGISNFGKEMNSFTIAGADKIFYPAKAELTKGVLVVYSDKVSKPVAVRYAWENYAEGSIFNLAGLPASPFRTDKWEN